VPLEKTLEYGQSHFLPILSIAPYINKQVFPQAPSPTMTSLRRISAMVADMKPNEKIKNPEGLPRVRCVVLDEAEKG
jgi:hypothetical protein